MKAVFLNRYQNVVERGAEVFVNEISRRLSQKHDVQIFSGKDADSISKVLEGKFDIVIPINGRLQSLKVLLAKPLGGYKVLITGHSGKGWDDIWNIVVAKPDVFVALTDVLANWAKSWAWGSKVIKIPNGIDLEKFTPLGEKIDFKLPKPIILSVGALVWYKYHDRVVRAVSKLNKGSLVIVGEGEKRQELAKLGKKLLGDRFKIMNFKYEDMPKVYHSVDLFTLPSWDREAFGIVYLEALASGVGVVAPDDLSRKEIVGEAGLFVNTENSDDYAKKIEEALKFNWVEKARRQAEKFSWESTAKSYNKIMLDMIKD